MGLFSSSKKELPECPLAAGYEDITTIPALAEYFEVTPNFVAYRLTLPDVQKIRYREIV